MKKTYKKIKSTAPTSDKITSTNDPKTGPSMLIKISSANNKNNEESKNTSKITNQNINELETLINKLKSDIDLEKNNSMKNLNELNAQLKLLNNEINSLELNNKNLTNKINNAKKRKTKENFNKNLKKGNSIDKLNKKIKLKENMISNNKCNLRLLKKEKIFLQKEIDENVNPAQIENLQKNLEDIFKNENDVKKEIEKLNIIKNEHEITCKRRQKEYNKKIEIIRREIEFEQKKKDIFDKINNDKKINNNNKNTSKLNNITDSNISPHLYRNNDLPKTESEKKEKISIHKNIFFKNNNDKKNIFNYYLKQFNENKNKKRRENHELKRLLNSNINSNNLNDFNSESNADEILNIKSINNNKSNSHSNRALFTKSEKDFLLKLIPDKCLDNYENKYNLIMKENLSLQSKLNDKIRLKTLAKKNNLIKLENSELINNVYYKKKLKLDSKINESNKKKHEINEKIFKNKKLLNYFESIYNQKNMQYNQLLKKYRSIYNEIKKGNLCLKKGEQLTQENIIFMDKYGRQAEGDTSFNEIDDNEDHGQFSENYEDTEDNKKSDNIPNDKYNNNENEIENEDYNEDEDEDEEEQ